MSPRTLLARTKRRESYEPGGPFAPPVDGRRFKRPITLGGADEAPEPLDLADASALIEQLRRRCSLSERALDEHRQRPSTASQRLVKAWSESAELRELLDEREETHRRSTLAAQRLRLRAADLSSELERVGVQRDSAFDELHRTARALKRAEAALVAEREAKAFAHAALRSAKRRDAGLRARLAAVEGRVARNGGAPAPRPGASLRGLLDTVAGGWRAAG